MVDWGFPSESGFCNSGMILNVNSGKSGAIWPVNLAPGERSSVIGSRSDSNCGDVADCCGANTVEAKSNVNARSMLLRNVEWRFRSMLRASHNAKWRNRKELAVR